MASFPKVVKPQAYTGSVVSLIHNMDSHAARPTHFMMRDGMGSDNSEFPALLCKKVWSACKIMGQIGMATSIEDSMAI